MPRVKARAFVIAASGACLLLSRSAAWEEAVLLIYWAPVTGGMSEAPHNGLMGVMDERERGRVVLSSVVDTARE